MAVDAKDLGERVTGTFLERWRDTKTYLKNKKQIDNSLKNVARTLENVLCHFDRYSNKYNNDSGISSAIVQNAFYFANNLWLKRNTLGVDANKNFKELLNTYFYKIPLSHGSPIHICKMHSTDLDTGFISHKRGQSIFLQNVEDHKVRLKIKRYSTNVEQWNLINELYLKAARHMQQIECKPDIRAHIFKLCIHQSYEDKIIEAETHINAVLKRLAFFKNTFHFINKGGLKIPQDLFWALTPKTLSAVARTGHSFTRELENICSLNQENNYSNIAEMAINTPEWCDFQFAKKLGEGAYKKVYLGIHKRLKFERAIGVFMPNERIVEYLKKRKKDLAELANEEIELIEKLKKPAPHPNIILMERPIIDYNKLILVQEKYDCTLEDRLKEILHVPKEEFKYPLILDYAKQISLGLEQIHSKGVFHGDLTASNIGIIKYTQEGQEKELLKLSDFGLSSYLRIVSDKASNRFVKNAYLIRAPEQYACGEIMRSQKTDIWQFGVLFYRMLTGEYPFVPQKQEFSSKEEQDAFEKDFCKHIQKTIKEGKLFEGLSEKIPVWIKPKLESCEKKIENGRISDYDLRSLVFLLKGCFELNPELRFSAAYLKNIACFIVNPKDKNNTTEFIKKMRENKIYV